MEPILIVLLLAVLFVLLILIGAVVWLAMRTSSKPASENNEQIANLAGKLDAIQSQVDGSLQSVSTQVAAFAGQLEAIQKQVDGSLQSVTNQVAVFGEVKESLGQVTEATNRVAKLGEDINKLESILHATNRRGGFGEILLENLLAQVLPEKHFRTQYSFQDKARVDAAIFLGERILPIDSKFPLHGFDGEVAEDGTYQKKQKSLFIRAVKDRMDETSKYIRPAEGTFEFAMMYIPAENVYYEIVSNSDLFNYSMQKRVIPVSPNSFFAYLQVVVFGLKGMQIEENAREILGHISSLKIALDGVQEQYEKLGTSITYTQSRHAELGRKLGKFSTQFERLAAETLPQSKSQILSDGEGTVYKQGDE
jgi:DNA recombination protein RmuC